jgi:hypothetical protein
MFSTRHYTGSYRYGRKLSSARTAAYAAGRRWAQAVNLHTSHWRRVRPDVQTAAERAAREIMLKQQAEMRVRLCTYSRRRLWRWLPPLRAYPLRRGAGCMRSPSASTALRADRIMRSGLRGRDAPRRRSLSELGRLKPELPPRRAGDAREGGTGAQSARAGAAAVPVRPCAFAPGASSVTACPVPDPARPALVPRVGSCLCAHAGKKRKSDSRTRRASGPRDRPSRRRRRHSLTLRIRPARCARSQLRNASGRWSAQAPARGVRSAQRQTRAARTWVGGRGGVLMGYS